MLRVNITHCALHTTNCLSLNDRHFFVLFFNLAYSENSAKRNLRAWEWPFVDKPHAVSTHTHARTHVPHALWSGATGIGYRIKRVWLPLVPPTCNTWCHQPTSTKTNRHFSLTCCLRLGGSSKLDETFKAGTHYPYVRAVKTAHTYG